MKIENKRAIESIVAMIKSDGLNATDRDGCLHSISQTCLPTRLSDIYIHEVLPVAIECEELGADFERMMKWRLSI